MALANGSKLGPYEIHSPLGAGGMGEIYRARDTRLGRTVAIKILPSHLSSSPDAKQRFEREARAISSLNHPNICTLYDVGHQDGTDFLVMEYLEGETLADRLLKGPLPPEQVLKSGVEICEGLEKAHRSGVIHRDLKPSNIMLTKTGAKLMDFGLAKATTADAAPSSSLSNTFSGPSADRPLTAQGMVVGTFQYMAPEQVEGKEADARSDIFGLGAVLYEMATGQRAFTGKSQAGIAAAILASEPPPISSIQPMSPPALDQVVRTCLAKDPEERWQAVHDVKVQLQRMGTSGSQGGAPASVLSRRRSLDRAGWLVALLLLFLLGGSAAWWASTRQAPRTTLFSSPVPFAVNDIAMSSDGRNVAVVAYWDQANKYVIWTYEVGGRGMTTVQGTEGASHPFWSPDGRSIGFFSEGKLKKVDVGSGRSAQVLCDAPHGRGGAWNRDGVILFSPDIFGGLFRVSSAGGTPNEILKPDPSSETSLRWPSFLPDQQHFLFLAANFGGDFEKNAIFVGSLDSGEKRFIVSASSNVAYADGFLLYVRDKALVAQRFDSRKLVVSGEPRTLSDEVQYFPQTDLALFAAGVGTLVVQTGKGADKSQLVWFSRSGKQVGAVGPPGLFANPSLSPDKRRVALEQTDADGRHVDIWIHELTTDVVSRLTFGPGLNELPIWSPDGKQVVFGSNQKASWRLSGKNADGSGPDRQIGELSSWQAFWDWSRDGKYLLVWKNGELWYLSLPDAQMHPLFQTKWIVRNAQFSPDRRWITYASNETGNWEIYVSPFPSPDSKWQVSRGGGVEPRWRQDGKELFYLSAEGQVMAVAVKADNTFESGSPVKLFQTHLRQPISAMEVVSYDASADGQKFLVNTKVDEPNAVPLSIILNWAAEMEK